MSSQYNNISIQNKTTQPTIIDEKTQKIKSILNNEEYFNDLTNNTFSNLDFDKSGYLNPNDVK
jgi:hypothetical protein